MRNITVKCNEKKNKFHHVEIDSVLFWEGTTYIEVVFSSSDEHYTENLQSALETGAALHQRMGEVWFTLPADTFLHISEEK